MTVKQLILIYTLTLQYPVSYFAELFGKAQKFYIFLSQIYSHPQQTIILVHPPSDRSNVGFRRYLFAALHLLPCVPALINLQSSEQ